VIKGFNPQPDPPGRLLPPVETGDFLPPGMTKFLAESSEAPPPIQVGRDGSGAFVPPGMTRFFGESSEAPPPVQESPEGSFGFVPPGVIKGFNPQPDPPGLPEFIAAANE
jgi:hypothetical protein